MELDFSVLDNIAPAKMDFTDTLESDGEDYSIKAGKPATGQNIAPSGQAVHSHVLDKEKQERARLREAYSGYQQNIKKAGSCRGDILKGIQRGEDPLVLLLKAIECISFMTGDTAIYKQGKEDILTIYGGDLGEPAALHIQLQEAKERLKKLQRAEVPPEEKQCLEAAIEAHRGQIEQLEKRIEKEERGKA